MKNKEQEQKLIDALTVIYAAASMTTKDKPGLEEIVIEAKDKLLNHIKGETK